jgi:hypothetical protein
MQHATEGREIHTKFLSKISKGRKQLLDLGVDG